MLLLLVLILDPLRALTYQQYVVFVLTSNFEVLLLLVLGHVKNMTEHTTTMIVSDCKKYNQVVSL